MTSGTARDLLRLRGRRLTGRPWTARPLRGRVPFEEPEDLGRGNVRVALVYLEAWLRGTGAVAIDNLMEDAATAEIARSQIWQWIHQGTVAAEGTPVTAERVEKVLADVRVDLPTGTGSRYDDAEPVFRQVALGRSSRPSSRSSRTRSTR